MMEQLKDMMRALTRTLLAFLLVGITGYLLYAGVEVPGELWTLDGSALAFYYTERRNG